MENPMTRLLRVRVANEAFAQAFAWVAACLILNACTALSLLALPIVDHSTGLILMISIAIGWLVMGVMTYHGLRRVTAAAER
jgi:hypothetical protein